MQALLLLVVVSLLGQCFLEVGGTFVDRLSCGTQLEYCCSKKEEPQAKAKAAASAAKAKQKAKAKLATTVRWIAAESQLLRSAGTV